MNIGLIRRCNCHDVTTRCSDEMTKFPYFLWGSEILVLFVGGSEILVLFGGFRNSCTFWGSEILVLWGGLEILARRHISCR